MRLMENLGELAGLQFIALVIAFQTMHTIHKPIEPEKFQVYAHARIQVKQSVETQS